MNTGQKTKLHQLFDSLQHEYIVCIIRSKIYPPGKHTNYWNKVGDLKKERILDIARKNQLPCIFDDVRIMDTFKESVLNEGDPIKFYYTPSMEQEQRYWDLYNYYLKTSPVIVKDSKKGTIIQANVDEKKCVVKLDVGGEVEVDFSEIKRTDI